MSPIWMMVGLVVMVPLVTGLLIAVPVYAGIWTSLYLIYSKGVEANPFGDKFYEFSQVFEQYQKVWHYWQDKTDASFMDLTLPLFGPVIAGIMVSLILLYGSYRHVKGMFCIDDL